MFLFYFEFVSDEWLLFKKSKYLCIHDRVDKSEKAHQGSL